MRVALAAALFASPDVLLLDEPTNYLDLEGTIWLKDFIRKYRHTILLVSHDRDLLNEAVDAILHLDRGKLALYQGNYDQFERQRSEQQALTVKLKKKQEAQRKHMEAFVERFRYKATKARQAQSRLKALAKLAPIADVVEDRVYPFHFPESGKAAGPAGDQMGRRLRRLCARQADPWQDHLAARSRRPDRASGLERQWQVDLRQTAVRQARTAWLARCTIMASSPSAISRSIRSTNCRPSAAPTITSKN